MPDTVTSYLDECADLDDLLRAADEGSWALPTPAKGWTVAHQVGHLAWTDDVARLAVTAPDAFGEEVRTAMADPLGHVDARAAEWAQQPPEKLVQRWRQGRVALADALRRAPAEARIPWFGPSMSPRSMATARLMEVWAHGQDVADAFGVRREASDRLRDICHLGVRTRDFAYTINQRTPPERPFHIELTSPSGEVWSWGDGGPDRVTGSAEEFCLVVTQRREMAETELAATGEAATWLTFAQAFAGPPKGANA